MKDFITAMGLVLILEGAPYFLMPERMRTWVVKMGLMPDKLLRQTGFFLMILGLLVVYLARG